VSSGFCGRDLNLQYDLNFEKALEFTLKWEGGYVNLPSDPGGATKYGISLKYAQSVGLDKDGDGDTDEDDIKLLTIKDAADKYKHDFWDANHCGDYPSPFCVALFDTCVQHSPKAVKQLLAEANGDWKTAWLMLVGSML
jgi:lysozyme family protein